MKHGTLFTMILVILSVTGWSCTAAEVPFGDYRISGPYVHKNLSVFLIHTNSNTSSEDLKTLDEGLQDKTVTVFETGSVSELSIENRADKPVFIQAGSIVKGGRQDRTVQNDIVLQPHSGKVPIASLCVESARWSARGSESEREFEMSSDMIVTKEMKLACKLERSQGKVWDNVAKVQKELSVSACMAIPDSIASSSSLQLTLEHGAVDSLAQEYLKELRPLAERYDDAIGAAYAINGAVNNADTYRSVTLFRKMWPKLIRVAAIEASISSADSVKSVPLTLKDIVIWLDTADNARSLDKSVAKNFKLTLKEREDNAVFETQDRDGKLIHKNVIKR